MTHFGNIAVKFFDVLKSAPTEYNSNTIMETAGDKAEGIENKSAVTVALEDFTDIATGFHGKTKINITEDEIQPGFLGSIFNPASKDNVFRSDSAKQYIQDNDEIYRLDVIDMAIIQDEGLKYAKENDDIYKSALNFAKADIALIETSYRCAEGSKKDGLLTPCETKGANLDIFEQLNLDGDEKTISAEEYASYLIAIDGLIQFGQLNNIDFCPSQTDGIVTQEEIDLANNLSQKKLQEIAQKIYDENYKDKD